MRDYVSPNEPMLFGSHDSQTIQKAIAAAEADGTRKIVIPRYNARTRKNEWRIREAILVPSHFTIILDNCYMVMETGVYDQMFTNVNTRNKALVTKPEGRQTDIAVLGRGNVILDGGVHNRLLEKTSKLHKTIIPEMTTIRNSTFFWCNVSGLRVEDIHIENHRYWAFTHISCQNVTIRNIDFYCIPHVTNLDGIDLRVGCNNFVIENITGRTGDDALALTALKGFEMGWHTEGTDPDIHDVKIRNMKSDPYTQYIVRLLVQDGCQVYNIDMDTLMDASDYTTKKRSGSCLNLGYPHYAYIKQNQLGDMRDITARNITSRSTAAILVGGTVQNVYLSNIKTFRDNLDGIGVRDICEVDNFCVEHFWYDANQQQIFTSREFKPEDFPGTVLNLEHFTGNMHIKDLHVGRAKTIAHVEAGMDVKIDGLAYELVGKEFDVAPGGSVTLDGEVQ